MPTPDEVRREADDAVRLFSIELGKQERGVGVRPPPKIEVTQVKFERQAVNLDLDRAGGASRSLEGPPLPPPPSGPTGACCFSGGLCGEITAAQCAALGGTYHGDGTVCVPDPC